ncbi:hypothetical protein SERLA73DRAFT_167044 [Serpula lacrymans var. lacrymans S7.3]|uniref:Sld7 C-terminal domain-containing protein n=1 Tax=Serpula lacrymans var. lacrymans (strain S7.3) TaxID=936435 RepID=F8PSU8_SERL3|nr:hypothetical protein SERLA73DRAFT_167044 [Serpula lacrymans var. lacrymans S7.3]
MFQSACVTAPDITITQATPTKDPSVTKSSPHRLLYRGALSLPDSHLLLDGLTFFARLGDNATNPNGISTMELLDNPLALALESMRGRPTLRFKGTTKLKDFWLDTSGDVCMDIHPYATLTRVYFENILCLTPISSLDGRSDSGIRVSLGDSDGPDTTEIIIYGKLSHECLPSTSASPPVQIHVARITTAPRSVPRRPRPDDPTPRKPPSILSAKRSLDSYDMVNNSKRIKSSLGTGKGKGKAVDEDETLKRAREVMLHLPRQGSGTISQKGEPVFKVPLLPSRAVLKPKGGGKGKVNPNVEIDVFGAVGHLDSKDKNKRKAEENDALVETEESACDFEQANKVVIKKTAVKYLGAAGIGKNHPEFKELFGFVYRGTSFALRTKIKVLHMSGKMVNDLVDAHVKLYIPPSEGGSS